MREIKADYQLYSNDFTRQDTILACFVNEKCVALNAHRNIDLSNIADRHDAWLSPWAPELLDQLEKKFTGQQISSCFSVDPDFRKDNLQLQGLSLAFVHGALSLMYFCESKLELSLGSMRKHRKMQELSNSWGGQCVVENVIYNNEPTDLVLFEKSQIKNKIQEFPFFIHQIYKQKIDFTQTKEKNYALSSGF